MVLASTGRTCTVGAVESRPEDAPYMPTGTIELLHEEGGPVLHMHGDIDAPVVQRWEEEGESVDRLKITAVDVSDMAYIDSIGLSFLVRWAQDTVRGGSARRDPQGEPALRAGAAHRRDRLAVRPRRVGRQSASSALPQSGRRNGQEPEPPVRAGRVATIWFTPTRCCSKAIAAPVR